MRLYIIKFLIFSTAVLSGIGFYHPFTQKTQSEILSLTEKFQEAYRNQDENLINQLVADDFVHTYYDNKYGHEKSELIAGMKLSKAQKGEIISTEITPLWIQADREKPSYTFEIKAVISFEEVSETSDFYGQYTYVFERREMNWQIVSINLDANYLEHKPYWTERKFTALERIPKRIKNWFGN